MKKIVFTLLLAIILSAACCFSEEATLANDPFRVNPGYYIVGEDFEEGSYEIKLVIESDGDKSTGYIFVWKDSDSFFSKADNSSYSLRVKDGDTYHINLHSGNVLVSDDNIPAKFDFIKTR